MPHRKRIRCPKYDYSLPGNYFVTICTKNRHPWFGEIVDGQMILSEVGKIVEKQWYWLEKQYGHCISLDQFCVMPDHVHGIIFINDPVGTGRDLSMINTKRVGRDRPLQKMKIKPLPELIGALKTTSSKLIHQNHHPNFAWQRSFHDRIIRNEVELERIRHYIFHNPNQH